MAPSNSSGSVQRHSSTLLKSLEKKIHRPTLSAMVHKGGVSKKKKTKRNRGIHKRNPDNFLVKPAFDSTFQISEAGYEPEVYIDGACHNAGKSDAKAGFGVWWGPDHPLNTAAPLPGAVQTSNRAELQAAIHAIEQAIANEFTSIVLLSDSMQVVDAMDRLIPKWKANGYQNGRGTTMLDIDLAQRLEELLSMGVIQVRFKHVKGHSGDHGNEMADMLATQGALM